MFIHCVCCSDISVDPKESNNVGLSDMDRSLLEGNEFDIFLSFAATDSVFAEEMRLRLEHK